MSSDLRANSEGIRDDRSGESDSNQATGNESAKEKDLPTREINADQPFPWVDFLTEIKLLSTGAHSLLVKCGHTFDGTALTIYAGKPFVKKKLDQALPHLSASLQKVGVQEGTITILASTAPAKDSQAASILAMMGGGEEVTL